MSKFIVQIRQSAQNGQIYLQTLNIEVEAPTPAEAQQVALANLNPELEASAAAMVSTNKPGSPPTYRFLGTIGAHNRVISVTRVRGS